VISASLKQHKVPLDLIAVAFIESGFGPTAVSSAGATGMWQFMAGTARAYGLVVDSAIDERRSVWRSTDAAARHLADLYEYFRSWDLALAAYNYGYKGLSSRIEQAGTEDFWSLAEIPGALPRETVLYVPKVLAVAVILNNLEAFGFGTVSLDQPLEVAEVEVPAGVRLSILARSAGTSLAKIRSLNPEFRKDATPERGGPVRAHIPASGLARSGVMLSRLIEQADQDVTDVKVSPDFDWGRDDMTDWRARLSQDEEAGKARTEVPTAMLSVSTSDNRSEPRSSCELPRSEVTSQQFSGALPTADSTSRAAAPPEAPRPKWAPRSPLVKPPAAMRALRNKVSRMRHDRKGAGTPEPTRTAGLGAARQPVDGKQSHAAGVYERLKKTVAN
jgi:membrane-bound lytic murein transglycosylase D